MKKKNNDFIRSKHVDKNMYRKDNGKKKWTFYLVLVLMIFWSIGSVLGIVVTAKDCRTAKADEVATSYTYTTSNLVSSVNAFTFSGFTYQRGTINSYLNFKYIIESTSTNVRLTPILYNSTNRGELTIFSPAAQVIATPGSSITLFTASSYNYYYGFDSLSPVAFVNISFSGDFNADVVQINLYNEPTSYTDYSYNIVEYFDSNGNSMIFKYMFYVSSYTATPFDTRSYFLSTDISSNEYYQNGFNEGKSEGISEGQEIGYRDGYQAGQTAGYNQGYNVGLEDSNQYSFLSLLGAVVDAPIKALTGLLNFDILGINLSNFFFGIITITLIIFVVRLFI